MATKKALGKGLDSIIVDKYESRMDNENVSRETFVSINLIEPNRGQPRKYFNDDTLQELADSIKVHGIIQPIIIKKHDIQNDDAQNPTYEIIAGERRWRAARLAGLKEIPVIIKDYTKQEILEIALIENLQREDLNPIEEAMAFSNLIKEYDLRQDEVAERVGISRVAVTNSMRLLKLDSRVQQMLVDEMLSGGHARSLLAIKDEEEQYKAATKVFDEKLNVRETEKLVKRLQDTKQEPDRGNDRRNNKKDDIIYQNIENKIRDILGCKVEIKRNKDNKGRIEIEYYSLEELERIIELLATIHS